MSPTKGFSGRSAEFDNRRRVAEPHRVSVLAAAVVGSLALYALAEQPLLAVWSALALFGWMFVAGAAKASSE